MKIQGINEEYEYHLTGKQDDIEAAEVIINNSFQYSMEHYNGEDDLTKKRTWGTIINRINMFVKSDCLEDAGAIIHQQNVISHQGLDGKFKALYTRYRTVESVVKDFPVKRENPFKSNDRRDYDKTVGKGRFFFAVSGMDDKTTKQAYNIISPLFEEMKNRYSFDNDNRWIFMGEGIREVIKRNNLLAPNILNVKDLFTVKHIRHLMNEIRREQDENPVYIDEDEDFIIESEEEETKQDEPVPEYDYSIPSEPERELKSSGGFFDKLFKK